MAQDRPTTPTTAPTPWGSDRLTTVPSTDMFAGRHVNGLRRDSVVLKTVHAHIDSAPGRRRYVGQASSGLASFPRKTRQSRCEPRSVYQARSCPLGWLLAPAPYGWVDQEAWDTRV